MTTTYLMFLVLSSSAAINGLSMRSSSSTRQLFRMRLQAAEDNALSSDEMSQRSGSVSFVEPTTNVRVTLVGAMHYNPVSIALACSTCEELAANQQLASVIVESCPSRWNKTMKSQPEGSFMRKLFDNEMQAASEVAVRNNLPVVLGDQDIASTNKRMAQTFKQSVVDLLTPWKGGWNALYTDITDAARLTLPSGSQYLGTADFFNLQLLLASPVSLIRYPLSFMVKSPKYGIPVVVALIYALLNSGDSNFVGTNLLEQVEEILTSATIFGVETAVFARVFLVALLAERNEVLAANILSECRRAAAITAATDLKSSSQLGSKMNGPQQIWAALTGTQSTVTTSPTTIISSPTQQQVVVAVLGAAHVNGIRLLLEEGNGNKNNSP